jgi:hypothetical protein
MEKAHTQETNKMGEVKLLIFYIEWAKIVHE